MWLGRVGQENNLNYCWTSGYQPFTKAKHTWIQGSTASQEDDFQDWIDYIKGSTKETDGKMLTYNIINWIETQKKLKWRQALRIATQS